MPKHTVERFVFMGDEWDVAKAWRIIEREHESPNLPRDPYAVPVAQVGTGGLVQVDHHRLDSDEIDFAVPLLAIRRDPLSDDGPNAKTRILVIDGYHRIAKAEKLGIETLPCHVLSRTESFSIEVAGWHARIERDTRAHRPLNTTKRCGAHITLCTRTYSEPVSGLEQTAQWFEDRDGLPVEVCASCEHTLRVVDLRPIPASRKRGA